MNTSTTRTECVKMDLIDFVEFVEDLGDEAEKIRKLQEKGAGRRG